MQLRATPVYLPVMSNPGARKIPSARAAIVVSAAMTAMFAGSLLVHRAPPALGDFGDWVYEAVLFRDFLLGIPHAAYLVKHYPVPNSLNTAVTGALMLAMPWQWAARVYLCLQLAFQFCAAIVFFHAVRSVGRAVQPAVWLVAPGAIFLGVNFWYGFMNFQVGVAWAMLVCALLLWRARPVALYATLLVCAFFTHMIPCVFACLALIFAAWYERRPKLLFALLPTAVLSLWYLAGRFLIAHNADATAKVGTKIRYMSGDFFAYKINSFLKSFGFVNPSSNLDHSVALAIFGDKLFLALFLINALLAGIFLYLVIARCARSLRQHSPDAFLWLTVLVFAGIYVVAPGTALGVSDPGSRALQVALWLALFPAAEAVWPMRIAATCGLALFAANLFLFVSLATSPPRPGESASTLPSVLTHFGHVPYQDKTQYYRAIDHGQLDLDIFPTGLFLKR